MKKNQNSQKERSTILTNSNCLDNLDEINLRLKKTIYGQAVISDKSDLECLELSRFSKKHLKETLESFNPIRPVERTLSRERRSLLLHRHKFFKVLPWQFKSVSKIISMFSMVYDPGYLEDSEISEVLHEGYEADVQDEIGGFVIMGNPGFGKTTLIKKILKKIPACIIHQDQGYIQIPAILVNASNNPSPSTLYFKILEQFSVITGVDYLKPNLKKKEPELQKIVHEKFEEFHTAILFCDEAQRFYHKGQMSQIHESMVNFIQKNNNLGIVFIGLSETLKLLEAKSEVDHETKHFTRRIAKQGLKRLQPFLRDDPAWTEYVDQIWKHLVLTETETELTGELRQTINEISQGILYKVYDLIKLAMFEVLERPDEKSEEITPEFLMAVARSERLI